MSKDVKRMSLEQAESFTSDQVTSAIKSCRSSRAYGPDTLSIFHLKNLGPLATEHLTALYNDSLKSCRLPSIWKTSFFFLRGRFIDINKLLYRIVEEKKTKENALR